MQNNNENDIDSISIEIKDTSDQNSNESANLILHKTNLILLNNGWNDKNESLVISIGENAASYKWMHERCNSYYKFQGSIMNITIIILAVILTIESTLPQSYFDYNSPLFIVKQVLTYVITILTIIQNFLKSEQKGEKHLNASLQFNDLYHDIQKQMCMYRRDRVNASIYLSENLKRYDSLVINNPVILSFIVNRFKRTFKNSNIALPDIADKIQKIEIITENQSNQVKTNISTKNKDNTSSTNIDISCNNLSQIHNAFQIHGDISDQDLQNINPVELKELRNKFIQKKSNYEYERFLQHSNERD